MVVVVCSTCNSDSVGLIETKPKRPLIQCQNDQCKDYLTPILLTNENIMENLKRS